MLLGHRTGKPAIIAAIALIVVADFVFTATAVVAQPVTGALLAWNMGFSLGRAGSPRRPRCTSSPARCGSRSCGCKCACEAAAGSNELPAEYHRLFRLWFAFGFPAFGAVLAIFWLMMAKPQLW